MNKLKKLFGPRNLATTFATGMLLCGTAKVWADTLVSACREGIDPGCTTTMCANLGGGTFCSQTYGGFDYYWCCGNSGGGSCGSYVPYGYNGCTFASGCGT